MKITTDYWRKPGPNRECDWAAWDASTYDLDASITGYGATEADAITDLMTQLYENGDLDWLLEAA